MISLAINDVLVTLLRIRHVHDVSFPIESFNSRLSKEYWQDYVSSNGKVGKGAVSIRPVS